MNSELTEKYARFCRLLREERERAGLSQEEVAARLNRLQIYISKYELGVRRIDIIEFLEIADVIGFNPVTFIEKLRPR
jgi:transcriptional regulator with XRE-family HTH domain